MFRNVCVPIIIFWNCVHEFKIYIPTLKKNYLFKKKYAARNESTFCIHVYLGLHRSSLYLLDDLLKTFTLLINKEFIML